MARDQNIRDTTQYKECQEPHGDIGRAGSTHNQVPILG